MVDRYFVYLIKPVRENFSDTLSPEEIKIMQAHFDRLKSMTESGKVLLAGPCEDEAFGIVIFKANSRQEAEQVMLSDPVVANGLMSGEVHPFKLSLLNTEIKND